MHILFLTHYFPPEVNAPASRTFEHAREWVKQAGVKVTVITNHPNHPNGVLFPGHKNRWFQRESVEGIEVLRVKTFIAANKGFGRRILNYLFFMVVAPIASFRVREPSVIVATSPQFFCAVAGFLTGFLKRKPFVFELRDIWPDSIVAVGAMKRSLAVRLLEKLELFLYRRAAVVIAVTDAFKRNLVKRGITPGKIAVIKNGVDFSFFAPQPPDRELIRSLGAEEKFIVSYIGTIGMAHAIDRIIETAERLKSNKDILFLIVGEGAAKSDVEALVRVKALTNVKVLPGVPRARVRDFYALTHLNLVTLRKTELFTTVIPSKLFEIMSMARPLLITVDGEARQVIEEAGSGVFVEPENVTTMTQRIEELSKSSSRLEEMSHNGRAYVVRKFDRRLLAADMLKVLKVVARPQDYSLPVEAGVPG